MTQRDFPREPVVPIWVYQSVYTATPREPRYTTSVVVTCRYCSSRVEDGARCSHCGATDQWRKP